MKSGKRARRRRVHLKALIANSVNFVRRRPVRLGQTLRHQLRMAHDHRRRPERTGSNRNVLLGKFAGSDALADHLFQQQVHAVDMLFDDVPVALDGRR